MTNTFEMEIHIGNLIKEEFIQQGRRAEWLAQQLNCNRTNVYNIFQRKNIDVEMLIKISRVLHRNFLRDISPLADTPDCTKSSDNMSKIMLHPVQKDDTAS